MLLVREARAAFLAGELERALELVAEPDLELDPDARALVAAALERIERAATAARHAGDAIALRAELERLARHAPERALAFQRTLTESEPERAEPSSARSKRAVDALLQVLRAESARVAPRPAAAENVAVTSDATEPKAPSPERPRLFHLAVDDGGEFLVASGARLVFGHLRSRAADLPFLADVGGAHAELVRAESFHGGQRWHLAACAANAALRVNGVALPAGGASLSDGDRVELARNLAFRFVANDAASSSALLELEHGVECHGALRVLLLCPGAAGRVRIGPKRRRLVTVADLEHDVALELAGDTLRIACPGGLRCGGESAPAGPGAALSIPCPPTAPIDVHVAARPRTRPPFLLLFRPLVADPGAPGT